MDDQPNLRDLPLPDGIRSRFIDIVNGLRMHVLEAGYETADRPCLLLLHGFPELAFSWRKLMVPLAQAGFHVIAPDQRGYGRTTGWDGDYDGDLRAYGMLNLVRDILALVNRLGLTSVDAVIGHDAGSPVAAHCALIRPDVFKSVAMMSAPYDGPPEFPPMEPVAKPSDIHADLAALARPRKHYQWYYGTRAADADMRHCPQGIADFFRAYYHVKSADWAGNTPHLLEAWTASELAKMPTYYIMDADQDMAQTVAPFMPTADEVTACQWLTNAELAIYAGEFSRNGFQSALQWYRCMTDPGFAKDLRLFSGRTIDVPACFIAGDKDWGIYQKPGALETMQNRACTNMTHFALVPGAGHWVQQEQPQAVCDLLIEFLSSARNAKRTHP